MANNTRSLPYDKHDFKRYFLSSAEQGYKILRFLHKKDKYEDILAWEKGIDVKMAGVEQAPSIDFRLKQYST
eukprot:scaffold619020_cov13-Prasinocladus_malaysianus.AAC.1